MKNFLRIIIFTLMLILPNHSQSSTNLSFHVSTPIAHEKIKCMTLVLNSDNYLIKFAKSLKYDLEFTDQLNIELKGCKKKPSEQDENKLFNSGTSLCLYMDSNANQTLIELKDICSKEIIYNKKFDINYQNMNLIVHKVSSELLPILTGEESISLYAIAYCKQISQHKKNICLSDFSCNFEKTLITNHTVNTAPCWHSQLPIIFYSQFGTSKIILNSFNLKTKTKKNICSYDGLNMQPSFSPDGSKVALCMSGGKNSEIYLYDKNICEKLKKDVYKPITKNGGNNVSPFLLENGDIIFCSDFQTGLPQIYYLNKKDNYIYRLTNGSGYCAAPSYCPKNNSIVYTRILNGTFQLFTVKIDDFANLQEKQLTFNHGNKHEPDFSPCGKFILFSYDFEFQKGKQTQQVAVLNTNSGKIRVLTNSKSKKSFPRWSKKPIFA